MERLFIVRPGQALGESLTDDGRDQVMRLAGQIAEHIHADHRVTVLTCTQPLFRQTAELICRRLRAAECSVSDPIGIAQLGFGAAMSVVHRIVLQCAPRCEALVLVVSAGIANTYPRYARQQLCKEDGDAPAVGEAHAICLTLTTGRFGVLYPGQSATVPIA